VNDRGTTSRATVEGYDVDDPQPQQEPTRADYSDPGFWDKLRRHARNAGETVVEQALQLYYALQAPATPKWAKTVILGALAYFILPTDAIPDFLPVAGYTDDLGALAAALATVKFYVTEDIKRTAKAKVAEWFGEKASGDPDG
jgi:uncharacterized membrane protein YkvA (DUF1232 family)